MDEKEKISISVVELKSKLQKEKQGQLDERLKELLLVEEIKKGNKEAVKTFIHNYSQIFLLRARVYCNDKCENRRNLSFDCYLQCLDLKTVQTKKDLNKKAYDTDITFKDLKFKRSVSSEKESCDIGNELYEFAIWDFTSITSNKNENKKKTPRLANYKGKGPLKHYIAKYFKFSQQTYFQKYKFYCPTALEYGSEVSNLDVEIYRVLMESENLSVAVHRCESNERILLINDELTSEDIINSYIKIKKVLGKISSKYVDSYMKKELSENTLDNILLNSSNDVKKEILRDSSDEISNILEQIESLRATPLDIQIYRVLRQSKNLDDAYNKCNCDEKVLLLNKLLTIEDIKNSYLRIKHILGKDFWEYVELEMLKNCSKYLVLDNVIDYQEKEAIEDSKYDTNLLDIENINILREIQTLMDEISESDDEEALLDYRILKLKFFDKKSSIEIAKALIGFDVYNSKELFLELKKITDYKNIAEVDEIKETTKDKKIKAEILLIESKLTNNINNSLTRILKGLAKKLTEKYPKENWIETIVELYDSE